MATDLSSDDVKREYCAVLGEELGTVYHGLYEEVAWLQDKWREFETLFGTSESRIELLQRSANRFFGHVQSVLWEDLLLHLSRLTDRAKISGRSNLSVLQLADLISDQPFGAEVRALVEKAVDQTTFARDWRNRFIAHRDLSLAVDEAPEELAAASRALVRDAVDALTAIIVSIHEHCLGTGLDLHIAGGPGDALDLLLVLRDGLAYQDARESRLRSGGLEEEDWRPLPSI